MKTKDLLKPYIHPILRLLRFIPDRPYLWVQYLLRMHHVPHFSHPKRFTEWLQWYKMNVRNPNMLLCADKYRVREYVTQCGCPHILNTLYQVCDDATQIDFDALPDRFVVKTTDGGGGENVFICRDKQAIDKAQLVKTVNSWRNKHCEYISREWAYTGAKDSKIIVEKYLENPQQPNAPVEDYKILCFNGKMRYLWVDKGRYINHQRGFWNERLEFLHDVYSDKPTLEDTISLPANINEMIAIAERLSKDFIFARVDLYNIKEHIVFGEITFYPLSGFTSYHPDSFDFELGQHFHDAVNARLHGQDDVLS